ncbi:MAG: hypothetical protein O8C66_05330 [Candidatus Methanoperedens sp.]|nr:hypothetical protein [Candidatus Methanoperedens sp.]MCZ7369913.1 hypothetical protein [Candidatus Methanoperedens sp.]
MSGKEIIKSYFLGIGYLFMLTMVGVLVVTIYNSVSPIDINSVKSVQTVALIFTTVLSIDTILLIFNKPTPTLIITLILISPILVIYKLIKSTDLIQINRYTPAKIKKYVPPKVISG